MLTLPIPAADFGRRPGPLARCAAELERARRLSAFQRRRELVSRLRLRESDALLDYIEQCRLRGYALLPTQLWVHVVRFVGSVDPLLRDDLGINRHPDHATEVLFSAQALLLRDNVEQRLPRQASIIPLFGPRPGHVDDTDSAESS